MTYKDERNVVGKSVGVVVFVHGVTGDTAVLLISGNLRQAVLAGDNAEVGDDSITNAMGSVQDDIGIKDGTTARLRARQRSASLERNLEGQRVGGDNRSTNNLVGIQERNVSTE